MRRLMPPRSPRSSLDDKYTLEKGRVFLTGTQALIRLLLLQRERDQRAGLNTAGFVSGYRGSPLGGLDQALWRAPSGTSESQAVIIPIDLVGISGKGGTSDSATRRDTS